MQGADFSNPGIGEIRGKLPIWYNLHRFLLASPPADALFASMSDVSAKMLTRVPRLAGLQPPEVASQLRHLSGMVFFDSAGHLPSNSDRVVSVIAARPERILSGSIHLATERTVLAQALGDGASAQGDTGLPAGGLCGWVDYEGEFVFGDYREMLVFDHADESWWEIGRLSAELRESRDAPFAIGDFHASTSREGFMRRVERAKEWIAAGDIYQVNLAHSFEANINGGSLFPLYLSLRENSPAPMAAWLALDDREILSSSPETFLKISGRGIETKPIKGTRPRFHDPDEDRRSAYELQTSAKEIAELVMITDLLRNDLGQVCEFGSVEVSEMLQLETLAQVHHLVSTVRGTLRADIDVIEALAACFPGGSITGAPKKRAMEIILELESSPRGIYCGAVGWLGFNGESSFNIAIRTLARNKERLSYHVGAGIVADSDPQKEYEETLHKAAGIRASLERCKL
jgi:aminodeoxychorismate synthase component I